MCGINGLFDPLNKVVAKRAVLQHMNNQIRHRGPDGEGVYNGVNASIGMRRLSIIDVAGGDQPIFNEDNSLALVCNGEIYNYVELMRDLKLRGHRFTTGSDVETILHLYEEKGTECLHELRGMFAFLLWDAKKQCLFAARDRLGIKPLYMCEQDGILWLSSEIKPIIAAAKISPTIDDAILYQFLCYGYPFDQRNTLIKEIRRVLPGEFLIADTSGIRTQKYWSLKYGGDAGIADHDDQQIKAVLEETIQIHLRSDVPVGILLSSGIDSSAIAAYAVKSSTNYTALCAGYVGNHRSDERGVAHQTAKSLNLPYVDVLLDPATYSTSFDQLTNFADEPVGDPAAMPQWELYKRSRELGYKVLMSGIGGDEVFFGYPTWNQVGEKSRTLSSEAYQQWFGLNQVERWQQYARKVQAVASNQHEASPEKIHLALNGYKLAAPQGPDSMASILCNTYLVHNGCQLADKLGMGSSIEVRVPFVDHVLMQYIYDLSLSKRFDSAQTKPLLRRLLRGTVPDQVLDGAKLGFNSPRNFLGELINSRIDVLRSGALVTNQWVGKDAWNTLCARQTSMPWVSNHTVRRVLQLNNYQQLLYHALSFECWYEKIKQVPML